MGGEAELKDKASSPISFHSMNIITIIIGLVIWLVIPILTNDALKKKAQRKAVAMLCRIVGIAIIIISVVNYLSSLFVS